MDTQTLDLLSLRSRASCASRASRRGPTSEKRHALSLRRLALAALLITCLFGVVVRAQEEGQDAPQEGDGGQDAGAVSSEAVEPDTEAQARSSDVEAGPENAAATKAEELAGKEAFLKGEVSGKPQFSITSLEPAHGPVTGDTKVVVRGGPFARYALVYPEPRCRFGNNTQIVQASYISCTPSARARGQSGVREATKKERTATCIQCEASPPAVQSKPVAFAISLTGDFTDVSSTAPFYYYKPPRVKAIKPTHGPKGGGTRVQVWGENFANFGDYGTCSFGTTAVKATVHDEGYITCTSPSSHVVARGMPFGVSLNGQQQTKDDVDFWYYPQPQVTVAEPASGPGPGPESGGNNVIVRGNNYKPFDANQGEPDISNSTFCAFTQLEVLVPAKVLNSTRAECVAPPSSYYRQTPVEITLNAQQRTDDGTLYFYYRPPFLFDVEPRQGPVRGGGTVTVMGTNLNHTEQVTCRFGRTEVPARLKSTSEIQCTVPAAAAPGTVELAVSLLPGLYSTPVSYLYYETPKVATISPPCGPEAGFTQLKVTGEHFVDLGNDLAQCVFNGTTRTNATVVSDTLIICDSPSLLDKQGYSRLADGAVAMHEVAVTLDGGKELSDGSAQFRYYREPTVASASPALGPLRANTNVTLRGSGFGQPQACKRVVRLGHLQVEASSYTNDTITFQAPAVSQAGTTVVSVSLNGQQFTRQPAVHAPARSVTYDYYRDPYASVHRPIRGPTNGGTLLRVQGYGFQLHRAHLQDRLWARFVDSANQEQVLASPTEALRQGIDSFEWITPPVKGPGDALLQISLNKQDWHDVKDPASPATSFTYYAAPHITSVTPSFGHVKSTKEQFVELKGSGFECFDADCQELKCRFGNTPDSYVYVQGSLSGPSTASSTSVKCKVPQYTKPDVLKIELTINDESYTSDNFTYGFFDPFVLDASPRLIAVDGSTVVEIQGIGFVDSGETKALFSNSSSNNRSNPAFGSPVVCGGAGAECTKAAKFVDKRTLRTPTYPQAEMKYKTNGKSVGWDAISIDATVIGEEFTQNDVQLYYYKDPVITSTNIAQAPANLEAQLVVMVDFGSQDKRRLAKHAQAKCRFSLGQKAVVTDATLLRYPFTASSDASRLNALHCRTPQWHLDGVDPEKAQLDISLNGQNFMGGLDFTFARPLLIHRDVPMAGPRNKRSQVRVIGQGFAQNKTQPHLKWGVQTAERIEAKEVTDYTYTQEDFLGTVPGSQELRAYFFESRGFAKVDSNMTEGGTFYEQIAKQQRLLSDESSLGGPAYLEVGIEEKLNHSITLNDGSSRVESWLLHNYEPSSVEFYSYREPTVQKMHPSSGLSKGGTFVEVIGTWFKYMPEYGIVPHCRFGDKVVRAHFDSTVRLVCQSPAGFDTSAKLPFEVSLNGVDWSKTGFTFSYYEEPVMTGISPDMGSVQGGDEVFIKGEKFSANIDPEEFKCRFTPITLQTPPRTAKAKFINSTTIMCPSPGGWGAADRMILQVTWNGVDYDMNNFVFSFYSIHNAFPRSGPSSGKGGDIIITGAGFHADKSPACKLNGTQLEPTFVNATEIRCPMPAAEAGDSFFGNVDFSVTANGITWHPFEGGFQYYEQPLVDDIDPKRGPSSGVGIINFYGSGFRADYALAALGCRLGTATGQAYYVSPRQVKCVVEDIPLLNEDEDPLPAQVSLNSYSYTEVNSNTHYRPYGVLSIAPTGVPVGTASTIVVTGKGFIGEEGITPRCKFGTPASYSITQAEILSYNRLACRAPEQLPSTRTAALPRDVPFSVALSGDEFSPWTKSIHRVLFYNEPTIASVDPEEVEVGVVATVHVTTTEDTEVLDPPTGSAPSARDDRGETSLSPLKCKFGRFGETQGVFVNSTTVKCTTPASNEPPESIYRELVQVSVALNGQDFAEETSQAEFTFVGTAPYISFATIILLLLALLFAGVGAAQCINRRSEGEGRGDPAGPPGALAVPSNSDAFHGRPGSSARALSPALPRRPQRNLRVAQGQFQQ